MAIAELTFESGVYSWKITGTQEECEAIDLAWRRKYKDNLNLTDISYGVSASGSRTLTVKGNDVKAVLNVADQLEGKVPVNG